MRGLKANACLGLLLCTLHLHMCRANDTLDVVNRSPVEEDLIGKEPAGEAFYQDKDYDSGRYGKHVPHAFKTTNITVPRLNIMHSLTNCDDGSYIFLAPRGSAVENPTAAIYDSRGSLIWAPETRLGDVYDVQVQQYQGHSYITYWTGDNRSGHGKGVHYMIDQQYKHVRNITAPAGFEADLHTFTITPEGTALATAYQLAELDFGERPSTSEKFYIWDCVFWEFDMETSKVLFEWRASSHIPLNESYAAPDPASRVLPWDYFHINMVEKDDQGNFLVSSRHMNAVLYVSGQTGEVLWKLGGKANMFEDLSGGQATQFVGQHDAHWSADGRFITLFDNRANWVFAKERVSKGRRIEIDTGRMTARIDAVFVHPENIFTYSQGSYQTLPNGNVLLGYGFTGAFAEFSPDGHLLCDAYMQPSSRFMTGDVQSYRSLKFNWTGLPDTDPAIVLDDKTLYVSWLGSTEVQMWMLQDSITPDDDDDHFSEACTFEKSGFETSMDISDDLLPLRRYIRVIALDNDFQVLRTSRVIDIGELATVEVDHIIIDDDSSDGAAHSTASRLGEHKVSGFIFLMTVCVSIYLWTPARRRIFACLQKWLECGIEATTSSAGMRRLMVTMTPRLAMPVVWRKRGVYRPIPSDNDT